MASGAVGNNTGVEIMTGRTWTGSEIVSQQASYPIGRYTMTLDTDRCVGTVASGAVGVEVGVQVVPRLAGTVERMAGCTTIGVGLPHRLHARNSRLVAESAVACQGGLSQVEDMARRA